MNTDKSNSGSETYKGKEMPENKVLSPRRSILRIFLAFLAFIFWIFTGYSPNILFTSGVQGLVGVFSYLIRNPVIFLIIALVNVVMGLIFYILIGTLFWAAFHFLWSLRWFYGFGKYGHLKKNLSFRS